MKSLIVLFGLLAWISCNDENDPTNQEVFETSATWTNMLAVDGCGWHFSIPSGDSTISLLPNQPSLKKIESALGKIEDYYSFTEVQLKYSKTGGKGTVQCGWGRNATYDEINIIEISKK